MKIHITVCLSLISWATVLSGHEISDYFSMKEEGAFLLFDLKEEKPLVEYNPQLCDTKLPPCSTFKIANALIGLDKGILEDENTLFKWDGTEQLFAIWERDHNLESAMRNATIWYFQRLAEKIGEDTYRQYLARFDYGNRDISSGLTNFWLGKSLLISPNEQLQFLSKLYTNRLPVTRHAMDTVKKILVLENSPSWKLSGKSASNFEQPLGWFVGHLNIDEKEYIFVTCIRGGKASGPHAKAVTEQILHDYFKKTVEDQ
jgi:beta-lactamase class D